MWAAGEPAPIFASLRPVRSSATISTESTLDTAFSLIAITCAGTDAVTGIRLEVERDAFSKTRNGSPETSPLAASNRTAMRADCWRKKR